MIVFPVSDQTAKNVMYIGGVHVIVNVMKKFQIEDLVQENACRALGSFAAHGEYTAYQNSKQSELNSTCNLTFKLQCMYKLDQRWKG